MTYGEAMTFRQFRDSRLWMPDLLYASDWHGAGYVYLGQFVIRDHRRDWKSGWKPDLDVPNRPYYIRSPNRHTRPMSLKRAERRLWHEAVARHPVSARMAEACFKLAAIAAELLAKGGTPEP